MVNKLDIVVLTHDIKEYSLEKGDIGTAVHVYEDGKTLEVEFITAEGKTVAVLTLSTQDIRPIKRNEILHARGFSNIWS